MPETIVTRNYQVTVPLEIRRALHIRIGDTLVMRPEHGAIHLFKVDKDVLAETFGGWGANAETGTEYVRKLRKEADKRLTRLKR